MAPHTAKYFLSKLRPGMELRKHERTVRVSNICKYIICQSKPWRDKHTDFCQWSHFDVTVMSLQPNLLSYYDFSKSKT